MQFGREDTIFPPDEAQAVHDKIKVREGNIICKLVDAPPDSAA